MNSCRYAATAQPQPAASKTQAPCQPEFRILRRIAIDFIDILFLTLPYKRLICSLAEGFLMFRA